MIEILQLTNFYIRYLLSFLLFPKFLPCENDISITNYLLPHLTYTSEIDKLNSIASISTLNLTFVHLSEVSSPDVEVNEDTVIAAQHKKLHRT